MNPASSHSEPVAVIDIGSNTIKILVAGRSPEGSVITLHHRSEEARITHEFSGSVPNVDHSSIQRLVHAVRTLLDSAKAHSPAALAIVATSSVREAGNQDVVRQAVRNAVGHDLRILSGPEEAELIGRGLLTDPAIGSWDSFHLFDLGGGSLEIVVFRDRIPIDVYSLPLGCVRLTDSWIARPAAPGQLRPWIEGRLLAAVQKAGIPWPLPRGIPAVGTGGTMTTARTVIAAASGLALANAPDLISIEQLDDLAARLAPLSIAERSRIPGIPASRADVLPVGLATLAAIGRAAGVNALQHSLHSLRYGLADQMLRGALPDIGKALE